MAAPPTLADGVKLPAPLFLRKLRRRQDRADDETPLERRAADLVKVMWITPGPSPDLKESRATG